MSVPKIINARTQQQRRTMAMLRIKEAVTQTCCERPGLIAGIRGVLFGAWIDLFATRATS